MARSSSDPTLSTRVLIVLHASLTRNGTDPAELYAGSGTTYEFAKNTRNRLSWNNYVELAARFETLMGGPEAAFNFSKNVMDLRGNELVKAFARNFMRPKSVYWAIPFWTRMMFPMLQADLEYLDDERVRFTIRIPEDLAGSEPFLRIWCAGLKQVPTVIGHQEASLTAKFTPHQGEYVLGLPPSRTLLRRTRAVVGGFFAARETIAELERQSAESERYFIDLLQTQRKLEEQRVKLDLSAQLASLSNLAALGNMAGGVAHEINSPLMTIQLRQSILARQLAQSKGLNEPERAAFRRHLDAIGENVERISQITHGLLAFTGESRGPSGGSADLAEVFREAQLFCAEKFHHAAIRLEVASFAPEARVKGDSRILAKAIFALLNNSYDAVKGLDDRWVRIRVEFESSETVIRVTDSGEGISEPARARLFEPFFSTKVLGKGTGLGLSTAKGAVESVGGALAYVAGEPDTTFEVRLQLTEDVSQNKSAATNPENWDEAAL
jgi:signal transduction histidine kinase